MFHLPSRLWSTSPGRFLWTGAGPVGAIPCLRAPMLRDFLGGPVVPAGSPAAITPGATVSPFVSWGLLGQANCNRYSVLIREIALLNWLGGKPDCVVTSCNNDITSMGFSQSSVKFFAFRPSLWKKKKRVKRNETRWWRLVDKELEEIVLQAIYRKNLWINYFLQSLILPFFLFRHHWLTLCAPIVTTSVWYGNSNGDDIYLCSIFLKYRTNRFLNLEWSYKA